MPTTDTARLTTLSAISRSPTHPSWSSSFPFGAPGRSAPWLKVEPPRSRPLPLRGPPTETRARAEADRRRSQQLFGRREQFRAVVVLGGVVLPHGPRERLPPLERRVVEVGHLGARLDVDAGDRIVVGHRAFDGEFLEVCADRHDRVLLGLRQLVEDLLRDQQRLEHEPVRLAAAARQELRYLLEPERDEARRR